MSVFENWLLRRVFELKRDAVTASGENYIMRNLVIFSPHPALCGNKIEKNEVAESCSAYGKWRSLYGILVWKSEGKIPKGRIRHRREDNVTRDLRISHTLQRQKLQWIFRNWDVLVWTGLG